MMENKPQMENKNEMEAGLGTDQLNTLDTFTLDCWNDRVYYEGREFPAGYFAAEILNFTGNADDILNAAGELEDPLLKRITALVKLVSQATCLDIKNSSELLAETRPLMQETVSWICTCPPFCYHDPQWQWERFSWAMDTEQFERDRAELSEHLPLSFLSFSTDVLKILVAIFNFCILVRAFEDKYLRGLGKRTADTFAKAAHDCFDEDNTFFDLLERMPFGPVEEFFSYPRLISGFTYVQDPNNKERWITAQRVVCKRLIDFYVFDLLNGFQHGHGPSWCRNCHRYFLTTTAHVPKYCDGIAPQDSRLTCRQYGAMMRQKEKNSEHPVYQLFSTRTNTIRKHHQRGKIDGPLREAALRLAGEYRDKALLNRDYAANGYQSDMELEHIYSEARKRLG